VDASLGDGSFLSSLTTINKMGGVQFDSAKAYAPQEEGTGFFDDGREIQLLHYVYSRSDIEDIRGNPKNVLAAIDDYARTTKYLMNVGEDKGQIVCDLIAEIKPKTMVCRPLSHHNHTNADWEV
jgi:hypothetical protein